MLKRTRKVQGPQFYGGFDDVQGFHSPRMKRGNIALRVVEMLGFLDHLDMMHQNLRAPFSFSNTIAPLMECRSN
jgi:hypothetical protein